MGFYNLEAPMCVLKTKIKEKAYVTNFNLLPSTKFFYFLQLQMTTYYTATGPRLTLLWKLVKMHCMMQKQHADSSRTGWK